MGLLGTDFHWVQAGLSLQDWATRGRWQEWPRVSGGPSPLLGQAASELVPRGQMNTLGSLEYNL